MHYLHELLAYHFMVNALRAGAIVGVVSGLLGYFMVLRHQSFAGHTLAVVSFPGAAGATWLGLNPLFGYFGFCVAGAAIIAGSPMSGTHRSARGGSGNESAIIGTLQAFALACGFLFVSLYRGFLSGLNSLLFGTIIGISDTQVVVLAIAGAACVVVLAGIARPLLFATIDPDVAQARGIPVRALSRSYLILLGVAAAATSQVTGSLLVFALLVAPAATATRLTTRPPAGAALSVGIAVSVTWLGEGIAFFSAYPIGFWVTTLAFGTFVLASLSRSVIDALRSRREARSGPPATRALAAVARK